MNRTRSTRDIRSRRSRRSLRATRKRAALAAPLALALALTALAGTLALGAGPAAAQAVRPSDLKYPPLPAFEPPRPQRTELPNGLVVLVLENHDLPQVEVRAMVHTGTVYDPADKTGLARLGAELLRSGGTERMRPDELDDFLQDRAATVESRVFSDVGFVRMRSLSEDFPEALRVFADVLRRPAFATDRLAVAKVAQRDRVARQNDDPGSIMFRELRKAVYGASSPWAVTPTYASLDRIGRDDLVAWHRAAFHPDRMVLGIVGDVRQAEALRLVEQALGDWPKSGAPMPPDVPIGSGPQPGVYYAEKSDVAQANIALGTFGLRVDDPDYYAVEVLNQVFSGSSGGFGSRLVTNVRTKKGLAYSVFGNVGSEYERRGMTLVSLSTKTATTGAGLDAVLAEVRALTSSPPTPEEVGKAKQAILDSFVFSFDPSALALGRQMSIEFAGYPADWLSRYRAGVEAVTVEQVRAAAAKYLRPESFAVVVVGPKEGMDRPLSDFGQVTQLDITIPGAAAKAAAP